MTSWINHFNHTSYSKNRVHRIMKKLGIHSVIRKKKKNIFMPSRMKRQKIYFKEISMLLFPIKMGYRCNGIQSTWREKKLYLSAIIDLYDRYPVAYVVSARNDNRLIFKTFDKAIAANPDAKPIFIRTGDFSIPARHLRKNLKTRKWSNLCPELDIVSTMDR